MCGIIGIVGRSDVSDRLVEALQRLEYRGYDSAGISTISSGTLGRVRAAGKLANLRDALRDTPLTGRTGIGHTRWATHGEPTTENAHPHSASGVMVVHNGIIENFRELRKELNEAGFPCITDTDTETIAQLIAEQLADGASPREAVQRALPRLVGAFAIAVMFEGEEDLLIGARQGSPLVVGVGEGEMFLGSDALAVSPFTNRVIYLEEGDWCVLSRTGCEIFDIDGNPADRGETIVSAASAMVDKGNYRHFMQKEIIEQPEAIGRTIGHYLNAQDLGVDLGDTGGVNLADIKGIQLVACGTSYYACMVAEYWFEQIAGIPVKVDIASEFRYREPKLPTGGLAVFVSQSGETADTLAALRYCKEAGLQTAGIVNETTSTIAREADFILPILAGPEIGVASTKAFTAMLCTLAALVTAIGVAQGEVDRATEKQMVRALESVPRLAALTLGLDQDLARLARELVKASDVLYLGRGVHYPIALEGALKLKEISYIHAEGYASGELKHGPIALIDEETPIVFVAPFDRLFEKSLSNLEEVVARRGQVTLITNEKGAEEAGDAPTHSIIVPDCADFIAPILYAIPVQLLAYHIAVEKGTDVDQPRNLAKSVTVE